MSQETPLPYDVRINKRSILQGDETSVLVIIGCLSGWIPRTSDWTAEKCRQYLDWVGNEWVGDVNAFKAGDRIDLVLLNTSAVESVKGGILVASTRIGDGFQRGVREREFFKVQKRTAETVLSAEADDKLFFLSPVEPCVGRDQVFTEFRNQPGVEPASLSREDRNEYMAKLMIMAHYGNALAAMADVKGRIATFEQEGTPADRIATYQGCLQVMEKIWVSGDVFDNTRMTAMRTAPRAPSRMSM